MAPRSGKGDKGGDDTKGAKGGSKWVAKEDKAKAAEAEEAKKAQKGKGDGKGTRKANNNKDSYRYEAKDEEWDWNSWDWSSKSRGGRNSGGSRWNDSGDYGGNETWQSHVEEPEQRSQLNSKAADFVPISAGYGYGGVGEAPAVPTWKEYKDENGTPYYYNSKTGLTQWEKPAELEPPKPVAPPKSAPSGAGAKGRENGGSTSGHRGEGKDRDDDRRGDSKGKDGNRGSKGGGKQRRGPKEGKQDKDGGAESGPPGCNLFVFHLPDDWTDDDFHEYFVPHGNIISAKVMKELGTGRSRGFGFVSYEDRVSAATAVKKMQGYKILGKRLKVEFKKGEGEDGDPVDLGNDVGDTNSPKKNPDDERLIGYLRAISAKNVVQSLKESEGGDDAQTAGD